MSGPTHGESNNGSSSNGESPKGEFAGPSSNAGSQPRDLTGSGLPQTSGKTSRNTFIALGGAREIGANSFYFNLNGHGLLIDGGLHPEKTGWDAFPRLEWLGKSPVDTFVVTHAHTDHLGAAPFVMQHYPNAKLIASEETIELARIMLANSASLLPKQHPTEVIEQLPNYTLTGLAQVLSQFTTLKLGESMDISTGSNPIKITFFPSGHILGAAGVLIETPQASGEMLRIFHTGDTSLHAQHLTAGASLPEVPVDILVTESTNGVVDAYLSHTRASETERLFATIREIIDAEGSVLIPVFALGKMQEVLTMLWQGMREGKIPNVDMYTGGMGRRISEVYDKFKTSKSRTAVDDTIAEIPQQEVPRRDGLFSGKYFREPSIVLSSSGMMQEGTASYLLAQRWLRERNFAICFVGYTDPRTPGYVVSSAKAGERIRFGSMKRDVPVRCRIERFRFSAHARREELLEIVNRLRPKQVVLTHGDENAMAAFGDLILQNFGADSEKGTSGTQVSAPELGKWYSLGD